MFIHEKLHRPLLDDYLENKIELTGIVTEESSEKSFYREVIVKVKGVKVNGMGRTQKILVQAPFYPSFEYGDEVAVQGKLKKPKDFKTDAGNTFHYNKFLQKDDIYYLLSSAKVSLIKKRQGNIIKSQLFKIKKNFVSQIQKILPRPESSLMAGMLIAGKEGLGVALEDKFKDVGLIHIVVLSGYNVTIIAEAFIKALSFLPMNISYGFGAFGVILFTIMAGGSSTLIRAAGMSLIALIGKLTGNIYSALRGLFVMAFLMIMWNPLTLWYDPSFQLSFLATFALIVFSPWTEKFVIRVFGNFGKSALGGIISSTLAVELFLLPYLVHMNGRFAFISFPANILVLSFIPFTMLFGFIGTTVSFISLYLAYPFSFVSFIMLRYILRIVEIASSMTGWGIKI